MGWDGDGDGDGPEGWRMAEGVRHPRGLQLAYIYSAPLNVSTHVSHGSQWWVCCGWVDGMAMSSDGKTRDMGGHAATLCWTREERTDPLDRPPGRDGK